VRSADLHDLVARQALRAVVYKGSFNVAVEDVAAA